MPTIVRQFCKCSNWVHKKLPHLIYFALATNYFNVFMSTTVLLGLNTSFWKIGGQWIFGGGQWLFKSTGPLGQWLQELNVEGCPRSMSSTQTLRICVSSFDVFLVITCERVCGNCWQTALQPCLSIALLMCSRVATLVQCLNQELKKVRHMSRQAERGETYVSPSWDTSHEAETYVSPSWKRWETCLTKLKKVIKH